MNFLKYSEKVLFTDKKHLLQKNELLTSVSLRNFDKKAKIEGKYCEVIVFQTV